METPTPTPCAWCGAPSDGQQYVGQGGETFQACSTKHAQQYSRQQSKPASRKGRKRAPTRACTRERQVSCRRGIVSSNTDAHAVQ